MLSTSVKKENLIKFGTMRTPYTIVVDCWLYQPPLVDVVNSINYAALAITKRVSFFLVNFFLNSLKVGQLSIPWLEGIIIFKATNMTRPLAHTHTRMHTNLLKFHVNVYCTLSGVSVQPHK